MQPLESPGELGGHATCVAGASCVDARVKLPHEVTTLDVAAPLTLALDSDAAIFAITTAIEFGPEASHGDACCWNAQRGWRACS
jgi:hypothetical protein